MERNRKSILEFYLSIGIFVDVHTWEHMHLVIHNMRENDEVVQVKGIKMLLGENVKSGMRTKLTVDMGWNLTLENEVENL